MKVFILTSFLYFFIPGGSCFSQVNNTQKLIKGIILSQENLQPLPYASIGILNKSEGSLTDSTGNFKFFINTTSDNDTIQISMVGYFDKKIAVRDFLALPRTIIKLNLKVAILDEVRILNKKNNSEILGREKTGKLIQMSIHEKTSVAKTIGSEMGMRYTYKKDNSYFKDFNFYISVNNFNSIKFKINIYSVKEGKPDTLIFNKPIICTVNNFNTGWIKNDLSNLNIKVPKDFIITIQWADSKMEKKENPLTVIPVAITPFTKDCYRRLASQDKWIRNGFALSNYVTVMF